MNNAKKIIANMIDTILCMYERVFIIESQTKNDWFYTISTNQILIQELRDKDMIDEEMTSCIQKALAILFRNHTQEELHDILHKMFAIRGDKDMVFNTSQDRSFIFPIMRKKIDVMVFKYPYGNIMGTYYFYLTELPYTFKYLKINNNALISYNRLFLSKNDFKIEDLKFSMGKVFGYDNNGIKNCPYTKESLQFLMNMV
jgi:hypothetical protein